MFEISTLLAFVAATLVVYVAPGVDMIYIASNSISHGYRAGLYAAGGVVVGVSIQALASAFGLTALFLLSPIIFEVLRWMGVGYLLYLGIKILRSTSDQSKVQTGNSWKPLAVVLKGIGINLLNPKISLFFVAFLPQFVDPLKGSVFFQLLLLGLFFSVGAIFWCSLQAFLFAYIGKRFSESPTFEIWQRRITGISFISFAGLLGMSDMRR